MSGIHSTVLWILGVACVGIATALLLGNKRPDGFLLARDEVGAARENVRVRDLLDDLEKQINDARGLDEATIQALQVRRAFLKSHAHKSVFAQRSLDDLRHALRAADDGHYVDDPDAMRARGVYGADDRLDHVDVVKLRDEERGAEKSFLQTALDVSRGVGAWMHLGSLDGDAAPRRLRDPVTLGAFWKLCASERFVTQPKAALGTAFLVRPDVVVTAAHVLKLAPLGKLVLVFDFQVASEAGVGDLHQVYRPLRVLSQDAGDGTYDWAVILLDRPVEGARVLPIARNEPHERDPLYMWGHSLGTPKKFMRGQVARNAGAAVSLRVELDAFGGDSGSPVLNENHEVVGVLYGGSEDLVMARGRGCRVAAKVRRGAVGEYVTKAAYFRGRIPR